LYIIKLIDLDDANELDNDEFKLIQNEIKYAKSLRHKNVVSLLNCFVQHTQIWCIYPYMYYGSLKDILDIINNIDLIDSTHLNNANVDKVDEQKRLCFNEQSLQSVAKSVLSALDYLHSKHIIHRCVCPENIYISHDGKVYLSGFKYCISLIENGVYKKLCYGYPSNKSLENYLNYLSPEMLQQVRPRLFLSASIHRILFLSMFILEFDRLQYENRHLQLWCNHVRIGKRRKSVRGL
jgi:serine/threonine protein kinase